MTIPVKTPEEIIIADAKAFGLLEPAEQLRLLCTVKTDKENLLAAAKADIAARTTALKKAVTTTMRPLKVEIESLQERAEAIVEAHRAEIMGKKKTKEVAGQVIAYRKCAAVEIDDKERALEELGDMANDPEADDSDRISAQACLRVGKTTLNLEFMHEAGKRAAAWLEGFGIRIVRPEKLRISGINSEETED